MMYLTIASKEINHSLPA